jgi:arsenate reductase (glutaredoxin)
MVAHPIAVNHPIVVAPKGRRRCRPSQLVFELFDRRAESLTKEDDETLTL